MTRKPPVATESVRAASGDQPQWRPGHWCRVDDPGQLTADPVLSSWLADRGSLTGRIRRLGGPHFTLEVLGEDVEPVTEQDQRYLDCREREVYVRRVRMSCDGVRIVFATTRIPGHTLRRHPWLRELQAKPLGEALADRHDVTRSSFEYAWVEQDDSLHAEALAGTDIVPPGLWARRSRFSIEGDPILVCEVFLPGLSQVGTG